MRNKIIFFFMFLIMIFIIPNIHAHANYGENDTYLGQIVDSYFNDDYVNVTSNVIYNSTLNCMELDIFEDSLLGSTFLIYTEVDSANDITVEQQKIIFDSIRRDADSYVYYDYGVDYFDDFSINFTLNVNDVLSSGSATNRDLIDLFKTGNSYGSMTDYSSNGVNEFIRINVKENTNNPDKFYMQLHQVTGGVTDFIVSSGVYNIGTYYLTLERIGTNVILRMYSDITRLNLLLTLNDGGSGSNQKYRYFQPISSRDQLTDPNDYISGYLEFYLSAYYSSGYYTTIDYLGGDRALALLYNTTIEEGTGMTLEFSLNDVDWLNHNNVSGYEDLISGFEGIDLRDLNTTYKINRVNMTSDGLNTPRMNELRYVTIIGEVEVEAGNNTPSIIMILFLILVGSGLIYGVRRK